MAELHLSSNVVYTSYFGNRKIPSNLKVSIARYSPKGWKGEAIRELAPSPELLFKYKRGIINEAEYERIYLNQLEKLNLDKILPRMKGKVLCCYEKKGFCHRHILRKWLISKGVECIELS